MEDDLFIRLICYWKRTINIITLEYYFYPEEDIPKTSYFPILTNFILAERAPSPSVSSRSPYMTHSEG